MSQLDRIQTIMQMKQPRIKEFLRDYDKLRHGKVSPDQFFRAFEAGNIQFTAEEAAQVLEMFGQHTTVGDFVNYNEALDFLGSKELNVEDAAKSGSLSGATFSVTQRNLDNEAEIQEIIEKLRKGAYSHPIIGKDFFSDYDQQKDGIINANQFARGLSTIYEAFFRQSPSAREIQLMIQKFNVSRLQQVKKLCMDAKELSTAFSQQSAEVDYRAFCHAIGAAGFSDTAEVKKPQIADPGFKNFTNQPQNATGQAALQKLLVANQKFRFDFKSFLQAKDTKKVGKTTMREFVQALSAGISDFKRVNLTVQELDEIALLFAPEVAFIKDKNCRPTDKLDIDQTYIFYRQFLQELYANIPNQTLMLANTVATKANQSQVVQKVADFAVAHPIPFRAEFQKFDRRNTGKVTAAQFKQTISQFIPLHPPENRTAVKELNKTSFKIERSLIGLDFAELEELVRIYAVDTTSGIGTVNDFTVSPDKLCGSGFLVDYVTFIADIKCESGDFIPSKPAAQQCAVPDELIVPAPYQVYYKIADGLCSRHLKLADCLNQGEQGSTKWNRTTFGKLFARNVQRALSSILDINLNDLEVAALCFDCEADDGLRMHIYLNGRFHEEGEEHHLLIERAELTEILDQCEISVEKFAACVKQVCATWNPKRNMCYSYQSGVQTANQVVIKAEQQERDGQDVTLAVTKHMKNHICEVTHHLKSVLGEDELVQIKEQQVPLGQLIEWAEQNSQSNTIAAASSSLLQLYYELHISRAQPVVSFQEFDKLRTGFLTPDQFSRAFVLAGLKKVVDFYPKSFSELIKLYTEKSAGRFQNMVDYSYMLRDLSKPPSKSLSLNLREMEKTLKQTLAKTEKKDYATVAKEAEDLKKKQQYDATVNGIIEILTPLALKYRPKLRNYFWDFDKRRSGICEASKVPTALNLMQAPLNQQQLGSLLKSFESQKNGYTGCFEWQRFVEVLEKSADMRL